MLAANPKLSTKKMKTDSSERTVVQSRKSQYGNEDFALGQIEAPRILDS